MSLLQCYNKSCNKKFLEEDNTPGSCVHHPGVPVFHEGLKGWSCCSRRTTNFSDFLEFAGCEKGLHNPIKPDPPKKEEPEETPDPVEIPTQGSRSGIVAPTPRSAVPEVLIPLAAKVDDSLVKSLDLAAKSSSQAAPEEKVQSCQNGGCKLVRKVGERVTGDCIFHSGTAVFHEGLKFWSCCQKRTSDFEEFMKQQGCVMGTHKWVSGSKPISASQIRFDYFQRGKLVVITFFGKLCEYQDCTVKASPTNLQVCLYFEEGKKVFDRLFELYACIIPESSFVEYFRTKVEVSLLKSDLFHWPQLEYPDEEPEPEPEPEPDTAPGATAEGGAVV